MNGPLLAYSIDACGIISLPGLGSFYSELEPAQIAFGEKSIFPASRLVRFESVDSSDSGKFVQLLISDFGLTQSQALEFVKNQADQLIHLLGQNSSVLINGFGMLHLNARGSLEFTPEAGIQFHSDSFGLPRLHAETLRSAIRQEVSREIPVIPLRPFDSTENTKAKGTSRKRSGIRWAAVAAVVAALAVSTTSIWYLAIQNPTSTSGTMEPIAQEASILSVSKNVDPVAAEPAPVETSTLPKSDKLATGSAVSSASKARYYVISGSFKQMEKSSSLQKRLILRGYDSRLLPNPERGITRVSLGQFSSKEAALTFIRQAQELFDEQLWIMEQ